MPARGFLKERELGPVHSIPRLLRVFEQELRFYREVSAEVGVRVPALYDASTSEQMVRLVLEDLSGWQPGSDPVRVAGLLREMHDRFRNEAENRWPWLRRVGGDADRAGGLIGALYDRTWPQVAARHDLSAQVRKLGDGLVGTVAALEREEAFAELRTLIHGSASTINTWTSPEGEVAFVDWEDVRSAAGEVDLAWLLLSSVEGNKWQRTIDAYQPRVQALRSAVPTAAGQAVLCMAQCEPGSTETAGWAQRLDAAASFLAVNP